MPQTTFGVTERRLEILILAQELSNEQVADKLGISVATVKMSIQKLAKAFNLGHVPNWQKRHAVWDEAVRRGLIHDSGEVAA